MLSLLCEAPCNLSLGEGKDHAGVEIVESVGHWVQQFVQVQAEVGPELVVEEQVEALEVAQAVVEVAPVVLLGLVEAEDEREQDQEADAQQVGKVQSRQTGILEDSQVPQ